VSYFLLSISIALGTPLTDGFALLDQSKSRVRVIRLVVVPEEGGHSLIGFCGNVIGLLIGEAVDEGLKVFDGSLRYGTGKGLGHHTETRVVEVVDGITNPLYKLLEQVWLAQVLIRGLDHILEILALISDTDISCGIVVDDLPGLGGDVAVASRGLRVALNFLAAVLQGGDLEVGLPIETTRGSFSHGGCPAIEFFIGVQGGHQGLVGKEENGVTAVGIVATIFDIGREGERIGYLGVLLGAGAETESGRGETSYNSCAQNRQKFSHLKSTGNFNLLL